MAKRLPKTGAVRTSVTVDADLGDRLAALRKKGLYLHTSQICAGELEAALKGPKGRPSVQVTLSIPAALHKALKKHGVNVSKICSDAIKRAVTDFETRPASSAQ